MANAFGRWVSTFYTPLPFPTPDASTLSHRVPMHTLVPEPKFRPVTDQMSPEELGAYTTPEVFYGSASFMSTTDLGVFKENADRALFNRDMNGESAFKNLDVLNLWCDMTPGPVVFTEHYIMNRFIQAQTEGKTFKRVMFAKIENANHFVSTRK